MKGPKPLYLLSVENKLEKKGKSYEVSPAPETGKVFSENDVEDLITALEKEEKNGLTKLLNMFFAQQN